MPRTAIAMMILLAPVVAMMTGCAYSPTGPGMIVPSSPEGLAIAALGGLMQAGLQAEMQRNAQRSYGTPQYILVQMPDGTQQYVAVGP